MHQLISNALLFIIQWFVGVINFFINLLERALKKPDPHSFQVDRSTLHYKKNLSTHPHHIQGRGRHGSTKTRDEAWPVIQKKTNFRILSCHCQILNNISYWWHRLNNSFSFPLPLFPLNKFSLFLSAGSFDHEQLLIVWLMLRETKTRLCSRQGYLHLSHFILCPHTPCEGLINVVNTKAGYMKNVMWTPNTEWLMHTLRNNGWALNHQSLRCTSGIFNIN